MTDIESEYRQRFDTALTKVAANLESYLVERIKGQPNIDRISARAKSPDRFAAKARKLQNGSPKYTAPFTEIQDQIGARITVFYLEDVDRIEKAVLKYFQPIEVKSLIPDSNWEFGYFGRHFIFAVPSDVIPEGLDKKVPRFFEFQIKTLFQHAWSEANHDLAYKSTIALTSLQQRSLAFTSAQAWGADRIFNELRDELT